ncbi:MAG: 4Fe-4S dicluster domain-containing protein, partial [Chloroflexi bacterium]
MSSTTQLTHTRRDFLKGMAASSLALWWLVQHPHHARAAGGDGEDRAPIGPAILIDLTRCTGCQSCVLACKEANHLPLTENPPTQLDAQTYTVVTEWRGNDGKGTELTRYVKRQCMHCLNPACVSACPAAAMYKSEQGPVLYRTNRCLGCRYCQIACPFGIPRFDWDNGLSPTMNKCWMCMERLRGGQQPACVEACPVGALRFGSRQALLEEAHARIRSNPDRYIDHVYGEHEVGGTSVLYLSDVPFETLGFPANLPTSAPPEETEKIMTKLPFLIGGLGVALTGTAIY